MASLAARPDVYFVRLMLPVTVNQVDPEGDKAHAADVVRESLLQMNVRGQGIKIGVISDTLNDLNDFYGKAVKANYVSKVTVVTDQYGAAQDGSFWCTPFYLPLGHCGAEGLAMLEIVHRLAPDAELFFATAGNSTSNMDDNIIELAAKGCNVIIDDVTFAPESPFQDGAIAKAVSKVSQQGVPYFSSAGNNGNRQAGTSSTFEGNYLEFGPAPATFNRRPVYGRRDRRFPEPRGSNRPDRSQSSSEQLQHKRVSLLGGSARQSEGWNVQPESICGLRLRPAGRLVRRGDDDAGNRRKPHGALLYRRHHGASLSSGRRLHPGGSRRTPPRFLHLEAAHSQFQDQNSATDGSTRGHNASAAANAFTVGATEAPWPQPTQIELARTGRAACSSIPTGRRATTRMTSRTSSGRMGSRPPSHATLTSIRFTEPPRRRRMSGRLRR